MPAKLSARQWLVLFALAVGLVIFWSSHITGELIDKDAADNLRMALNLKHTGVMSNDSQAPFQPSMFREPVPVIADLLAVSVIEAIWGPADSAQYFSGERARLVKHVNLFWLACLCAALFAVVRTLTPSFSTAVASILIMNLLLLSASAGKYMLNSLYTEGPAAVLLTVGSLLLSLAVLKRRTLLMVEAGICFGLLALVKASFLYVALGSAIAIPFVSLLDAQRFPAKPLTALAVVLALLSLAVVAPWMYRNYLALGTFGIASRGGEALYIRAVLDQMTWEEYRGSFVVYAPYPLNGPIRRLLGFSREDLVNGVRLQRLDESGNSKWADADLVAEAAAEPEKTHTFYRQAGADRNKLIEQFKAAGALDPGLETDHVLQHRGMQMILAHPFRHLMQTLPNLWRGAPFAFPLLLFATVHAWRRRDVQLALLLLPAMVMVMFYALISPYLPRYSIPVYPIVVGVTMVLGGRFYLHRQSARLAKRQPLATTS